MPALSCPAAGCYLSARGGCVGAALRGAGQGQGCGQLALGDGPRPRCPRVAQRGRARAGRAAGRGGPRALQGGRDKPSCDLSVCVLVKPLIPALLPPRLLKVEILEGKHARVGCALFPHSQLWKPAGKLSIYHPSAPSQGDISLEQNNCPLTGTQISSFPSPLSYGEDECRRAGSAFPRSTLALCSLFLLCAQH